MEKKPGPATPATCSAVVFLGFVAFSCCLAAEFKKAKEKDMKLDGNLCSMPRTPAFGLGIAALVCLSVAQILSTTVVASRLRCKREKQMSSSAAAAATGERRRRPAVVITLLALSWVSFGLATVLVGAGSSMNQGQPYGQGWMDGKCYVVRAGVYLGSAALVVVTVALALGLTLVAPAADRGRRTGPDELRIPK